MNGDRIRATTAVALAVALIAPGTTWGRTGQAALPSNRLAAVRVNRTAVETLVRIRGSRVPVFSVYTLQQPLRLVIDFAQGDVSKLDTPVEVDDGVLTQVVSAQYGEGKRAVGRVILGFVKRVPYDIKKDGNDLVVRIAAVGKERPTAAAWEAREAALRARDRKLEEREAQLRRAQEALEQARAKEQEARRAHANELKRRQAVESKLVEASRRSASERGEELARLRKELEERGQEVAAAKEALVRARAKAQQEQSARAAEVKRRRETAARLARAEAMVQEEQTARVAESKRRRKTAARLAQAQDALRRQRARVAQAEQDLGKLRRKLAAAPDAKRVLAQAHADARRAQAQVRALQERAQRLARSEASARKEAAAAARSLAKLKDAAKGNQALQAQVRRAVAKQAERDAAVRDLTQKAARLQAKLSQAQRRVGELAALRRRLRDAKSAAAAARALLSHKGQELKALRARLTAAEGVAAATARELEKVRRTAQKAKMRVALSGKTGPHKPVVVRKVDFRKRHGTSRVVLTVEGEPRYVVQRKGTRRVVLDLPGARLPKHLQRRLDVSEFGGPVSMVSAYESLRPIQAARVMVELRGPASYEVTRQGQDLRLELKPSAKKSPTRMTRSRPVLAAGPAAPASGGDDDVEVLEGPKPSRKVRRGKRRKTYRGRRINLDLQDADLHTVLKLISEVIRLNFVVSDNVRGKVTMTLRDVPWDQALTIILKSKGIGFVREGNIIRVALEKELRKEAERAAKARVAVRKAQPILLKIITVNYAKAKDLLPRVRDVLSEKGAVSVDVRTNRLIVRDIRQRIRAAQRMVRKLDTQTPQVLIEARIVEANTTFSRDIGIQWGGNISMSPATGNPTGLVFPSTVGIAGGSPLGLGTAQGILNPTAPNFGVNLPATVGLGQGGAVGFTFGSIGGNVNLNLRISAAEENGQAKIISAPKITTLDNQKATIQQGLSIPISQSSALGVNTIFVDANLVLTVTPHVTRDGSVIMDITATKNEPDFQRVGAQGDPTIIRKEARTQVLIKDGETTVIGGIYTRNVTTNVRSVPLLSRIPILGWLFKKQLKTDTRTELLIFITPRIVNRPASLGT